MQILPRSHFLVFIIYVGWVYSSGCCPSRRQRQSGSVASGQWRQRSREIARASYCRSEGWRQSSRPSLAERQRGRHDV